MFSPSDLMSRVGVGGGLVPFFKCVCVYFVCWGAGASGPSAAAAAAKCAPVLSLLAAVLLLPPRPPPHTSFTDADHLESRRYARCVCWGLAASALGDALLVWPQHFVPGMFAFAAAHAAYMRAFRARAPRRAAAAALAVAAALYLRTLTLPPGLQVAVPLYALLLVAMAWRALCTLPPSASPSPAPDPRHAAAPLGALLFLVSDAVLGYSLFGGPVPYRQVAVMSTYYLGQLGLALSALLPPPPPPSPPSPPQQLAAAH